MFKEINEREFSFSEVMTKGWVVYCQQIKVIAMIILSVHVPLSIIHYVLIRAVANYEYVMKVISIAEGFLSMIVMMGIIVLIENTVTNDSVKIGWRVAIKKAFYRWGSAIGTSILAVLIIFWPLFLFAIPGAILNQYFIKEITPMLFFIIPGIWGVYYGLCYIFIINVVTLHHISGKKALNYSKSLVKFRWWKTLLITVVLTLINVALNIGIGYSSRLFPIDIGMITDFFAQIIYAFSTVIITILFINLDYIYDEIGK